MLDALPRATFSLLAGSPTLKRLASRYGMRARAASRGGSSPARRRRRDRRRAARSKRQGLLVTLDLLGESISTAEEAARATRAYVESSARSSAPASTAMSRVKLTQLGLDVDRATCIDNLRRILDAAHRADFFVRIDMESSAYTDHDARRVRDVLEHRLPERRHRRAVVPAAFAQDVRRLNGWACASGW